MKSNGFHANALFVCLFTDISPFIFTTVYIHSFFHLSTCLAALQLTYDRAKILNHEVIIELNQRPMQCGFDILSSFIFFF